MTKKKEKSIEIKVDVLSTENRLKAVKKDLASILNDTEAIDRAVEESRKHSIEGAVILGRALTSEVLGRLGSALDLIVDLSIHSKESINFLERVQNKLIELSRTELVYFQAKANAGNKLRSDEEERIAIYSRNREAIEKVTKKKENERAIEIETADIRAKYNKRLNLFHQEEIDNLDENKKAYLELGDAIRRIETQKGGRKPILIELGDVDIKVQQKYADKALENLKIQQSVYSLKADMAEKAMDAEQKSQFFHQEALEKATKAQTERKKIEELKKIAEKERFQRLEKLQIDAQNAAEFEEELRNRKIEGLEEVSAVEINTSGISELLAQNNTKIAESEAETLKTRAQQWQEYAEKVSAISQQISEVIGMVTNSLGSMFGQLSQSYAQELESLNGKIAALDEEKEAALESVTLTEDQRKAREEELAQQKINLEYATSEEQKNKADERIATLQGELGAEDSINRDFESKKASLEKEKEKKEKAQKKAEKMQKRLEMGQAIVEAIGNIAQGAAKALSFGPILGPILAAIVSAAGAIQVGVMTKQLAKMEDGGLLRGKRHSQGGMRIQGSNIEVEGGEYVVNRQTTQKNLGLMNYINSQHKELTPTDINSYFSHPFSVPTFSRPFATMMEQGGQVPMLPLPTNADTQQILQAIGAINFQPRVAITDIHHAEQQMARVDEWTGM